MQYKTGPDEENPVRLSIAESERQPQYRIEAPPPVPEDAPPPIPVEEPWMAYRKENASSGPGSEYWLP
jgi:hypothetical protein